MYSLLKNVKICAIATLSLYLFTQREGRINISVQLWYQSLGLDVKKLRVQGSEVRK